MTTNNNDNDDGVTIEDAGDETGEYRALEPAAETCLNGHDHDAAATNPADAQASFWLAHLETEVKRLHAKWAQIDVQLKAREARIEELRQEIRARDDAVARLNEELDERAETVRALEERLADKDVRITELLAERQADAAQAVALAAATAAAEEERRKLAQELDAARAELERVQEAARREKETEQALDKAVNDQKFIDSLQRGIERRDESIAALEADLRRHEAEARELAAGKEKLAMRIKELEHGVQHGIQQAQELREELKGCREEIRTLRDELAERDSKLRAAQRDAAESARAVASLTEELAGARARGAELEARLAQTEARVAELQSLREAAETEADRLRAELAAQQELVASLERDLKAKQATVDLLERNVQRITDLGASLAELDRRFEAGPADDDVLHMDFAATLASEDRAETPGEVVELLPPEALMDGEDEAEEEAEPVVHARADRKLVAMIEGETIDYPLDKPEMTIGRSRASDIRIASHYVSRIHARVITHGIATVIEDAGSKNGILVNSERVTRCVLKHGDVVSLGGELDLKFVDVRP
ncbi:MAG TPA: FHA domain-containing protein [Gammaproteobacteria bacterium]